MPYRMLFDVPLRFGSQHTAIIFPAADLGRTCVQADAVRYVNALRDLESLASSGAVRLADRVRQVLRSLLVNGQVEPTDLVGVASLFSLHPRTLNRRLRLEGTTFDALRGEARYQLACRLLRDTRLSTTDIARALGYSGASAFAHAFRRWSGITARVWRSRHRST
jgi:AraC-like DNA-binding protein